ncbi:MAG: S-layer homology domain-containing protein [Oscillospiraceae bacterium]|nr:S-layer homology domain-containing protein [Oscillospiraceae bacterium]
MTTATKRSIPSKILSLSLAFLLILMLLPAFQQPAKAANIASLISTIESFSGLTATETSSNVITVTGNATNVTPALSLNIDPGITIEWGADFRTATSLGTSSLVLSGGGIFDVVAGGVVHSLVSVGSQTARAISASGSVTVKVSGGRVEQNSSGTAIYAGTGVTVDISSGWVMSSAAAGSNPNDSVIYGAAGSTIIISGGRVVNYGTSANSHAIKSAGTVVLHGSGWAAPSNPYDNAVSDIRGTPGDHIRSCTGAAIASNGGVVYVEGSPILAGYNGSSPSYIRTENDAIGFYKGSNADLFGSDFTANDNLFNLSTAPAAPILDSAAPTSVTLDGMASAQYRKDSGAWQSSPTFSGLDPNTGYDFTVMLKGPDIPGFTLESPESATATLETAPAVLGGIVTISGTPIFGETLTAVTTGLTYTPAFSATKVLSYQWKRGTTDIGTNSPTYTLVTADVGQTISVTVTETHCDVGVIGTTASAIGKADQAALTITGLSGLYVYGGTATLGTTGGTTSGTVTYSSSNTAVAEVSGNTVNMVGAGSFTITATMAGNANYEDVSVTSGSFTVGKANQAALTITDPGAKTFGDSAFQLATTGGSGTGAVTYELVSGPGSVTSGGMVTINGAGAIVVNATKAADANHNGPETSANLTITVAKADQAALTITPPGAKTFGDSAFQLAATGGSGGGAVTYELDGSTPVQAGTVTSGGLVTITDAGVIVIIATKAADDNYGVKATSISITVNPKPVTISTALNANVIAGEITTSHTVTLPELPAGVSYGAVSTAAGTGGVNFISGTPTVSGHTLTFSASDTSSDGDTATITIAVNWGANHTGAAEVVVTVHAQAILQEDEPDAGVNYTTEELTGLDADAAYTVNGVAKTADASGHIAIEAAWMGTTVTIIKTGIIADDTIDSDPQNLPIPARPAAPGGVGKTDTTGGGNNGTLTGVDATMEYSGNSGSTWTAITDTTVTGLAAGTYIVRTAATGSAFASAATANLVIASSSSGGGAPAPDPSPSPTPSPTPTPEPGTIPGHGGTEDNAMDISITVSDTGEVTINLDAETTETLISDAIAHAEAEGDNAQPIVTFDLSEVKDATATVFNVEAAQAFSDAGVAVTVKLPGAEITLPPETLAELAAAHEDSDTPITVEAAIVPMKDLTGMQAAQVKGYETVISLDVFVGDAKINVPLTVSLPYTLKANEDPAAVCVWYMDDKGNLTKLEGVYDATTGMITFTIEHQSYFVVGYDPVALWVNKYNDLSTDDPYYDAIAYVTFYKLFSGYGNGLFGAEDTLTRAQFATLLWVLEGKQTPEGIKSFTDVPEDAWYYNAVIWAADNSIVAGVGGGLFDPETPITRQEAAQMLYNYAVNFKGYDVPENRELPEYTDTDQIDAWAETAAQKLAEAGVLNDDEEFRPLDDATRGEAADLFRNFLRFVAGE